MANATTIREGEAAHFGRMAAEWWDPRGSSAMLHRLNPVRLRYLREQVDRHWQLSEIERFPLHGRRALDMGCGAGLLAEPLARLGATVTGVDAAAENIAAASAHADQSGLQIDYRVGDIAAVAGERFDLVTCLEVVEHVADPEGFVGALGQLLTSGGLLILSTPNRTALSRFALIALGESVGGIPKGTHDWDSFLTPDELRAAVIGAGMRIVDMRGLSFSPATGFRLSERLDLDYFVTATR